MVQCPAVHRGGIFRIGCILLCVPVRSKSLQPAIGWKYACVTSVGAHGFLCTQAQSAYSRRAYIKIMMLGKRTLPGGHQPEEVSSMSSVRPEKALRTTPVQNIPEDMPERLKEIVIKKQSLLAVSYTHLTLPTKA